MAVSPWLHQQQQQPDSQPPKPQPAILASGDFDFSEFFSWFFLDRQRNEEAQENNKKQTGKKVDDFLDVG